MEVNNNLWGKLGVTGYYSNPYAYYYLRNEIVTLLPEYEEFRCIQCGKFNEELALKRWINPLLRIKSKSSLTSTKDGVILANRDFRNLYEDQGWHGLLFLPTPSDENRFILLPQVKVTVDLAIAGFEYDGPLGRALLPNEPPFCDLCGRPKGGSYVGPLARSISFPQRNDAFVATTFDHENFRERPFTFYTSRVILKTLKTNKVTGTELRQMY